jgi:uncharacterized protein YdhG (YjbR/CyaY superfamily)
VGTVAVVAKTDFKSVDEYIASRPENVRPMLERVRTAIHQAIPEAEEAISYQIAAFKLRGRVVLYFAGWKDHYSVYPASDALVEELGDALASHRVSKGTIRFSLSEPVPVQLIKRIAKFKAKEAAARG